ncbi:hypothetical protein, partial [Azohydromonas australica]|uniref:hypothetical protein n=1 Tax=Azohydromonas australica TaxID=364039 RepID=UPI0003FDF3E7
MDLRLTIPEGVDFADLHLSRDPEDGSLLFDVTPIQAICEASGVDFDQIVDGAEPFVAIFIAAWYEAHLERGGKPDAVLEDFMEEARLETGRGSGFRYPPGHA